VARGVPDRRVEIPEKPSDEASSDANRWNSNISDARSDSRESCEHCITRTDITHVQRVGANMWRKETRGNGKNERIWCTTIILTT